MLVIEARPRLGGRATAFADRVTGELVDNGQHVLFGCYRETLRFLDRIGAAGNVRRQPALVVPFVDRLGRRSVLQCPSLPPPLHLLAAVLDWDAMPWSDRLSVVRMARPLKAARREVARTGRVTLGAPEPTVSEWLRQNGQGEKLTSWLWEPLAIAALNQAPEEALAAPFVRVLCEMFGPDPAAAALVLPTTPLHLMYAEPARAYIEAQGGAVITGTPARIVTAANEVMGVEIRGERISAGRIVSAVPWFAMRSLFADPVPSPVMDILSQAAAMESKPIVTVNLWYDRPVMDEAFIGLPGRAMQWVFDKRIAFSRPTSHLSLVASGAEAIVGERTDELITRAAGEVEEALGLARRARFLGAR